MKQDFTLSVYGELLCELIAAGFQFQTYEQSIDRDLANPAIVLRHDVDDRKENSLVFARLQNAHKILGTYYFRVGRQSFDERIILEIAEMGHEIGYHYETMDTCQGNPIKAYDEFCKNLEKFRKLVPIHTICMHGSPLSKFDNRDIWKTHDYKSLGIKAEPYFDLDFNETFYITDTGRRWNGALVSVRDKPMESNPCVNPEFVMQNFRNTFDIITSLREKKFPKHCMMTFHPQRWTNNHYLWWKELLLQNLKNQIKKGLSK